MKTKAIVLKTKKQLFGLLQGRNISKFKGNGLDFKELSEYIYGEDAKNIDWKISQKINKPVIKEYNEERELRIIIAVLKSGSLYFGTKKLKVDLIAEIISLLSLAAISEDNRVEMVFIGKEKYIFKPTKIKKSVYSFVDYALNSNYLGETYTQKDIEFLNSFKKSILILIGDFYENIDLSKLKHETYVVCVRDELEENPNFNSSVSLIDPVTQNLVTTSNVKAIKKFIKSHDKEFFNRLKKRKIPYTKIYTNENPIFKLIKLLR